MLTFYLIISYVRSEFQVFKIIQTLSWESKNAKSKILSEQEIGRNITREKVQNLATLMWYIKLLF